MLNVLIAFFRSRLSHQHATLI